jgi:hypothetical protein
MINEYCGDILSDTATNSFTANNPAHYSDVCSYQHANANVKQIQGKIANLS